MDYLNPLLISFIICQYTRPQKHKSFFHGRECSFPTIYEVSKSRTTAQPEGVYEVSTDSSSIQHWGADDLLAKTDMFTTLFFIVKSYGFII